MDEKNEKVLDAESIAPTDITKDELQKEDTTRVSKDVQRGVKVAEAVALTWSKTTLIAVFIK